MPTRGPNFVIARKCYVDNGAQRMRMGNRRDTSDGKPGCFSNVVSICFRDLIDFQDCSKLQGVDAMTTGGDY